MKAQGSFSPMNPGESEIFSFDFTRDLATGDSVIAIPAPVWSCTDSLGVDPNPQARLEGPPTLSGNQTLQRVSDPVAGAVYVLAAKVKTSKGNFLELWGFLPCRAVGSTGG
jgi:hypothetical protein